MKSDPVLVNNLKAILEPIVAARGWPDRRLVARQARRTLDVRASVEKAWPIRKPRWWFW